MVNNKVPFFETNSGCSEFIPRSECVNDALTNREYPVKYNNLTIEDIRSAPEIYDNSLSGKDKLARVQLASLSNIPQVKQVKEKFNQLKKSLRK